MTTLGVQKQVRLTSAKNTYVLDCRAARLSATMVNGYNDVLNAFIAFTGDMFVRELGPDHVRKYIAELSDRPAHFVGKQFSSLSLMKHYAVIRTWIRWMYAQKLITERAPDLVKPPRLPMGFRGGLLFT